MAMVDLRSLEVIDIVVCLLLGSKLEADAYSNCNNHIITRCFGPDYTIHPRPFFFVAWCPHFMQVASATTYFLLAALQLPLQDLALSLLNFSAASFRPAMVPAILAVAMGLMFYGLGSRPGSS